MAASALMDWRGSRQVAIGVFALSTAYLLGYKDVWEHSYAFAVLPLFWIQESRLVPRTLLLIAAAIIAAPTPFILYDVPLPPGPIDPEHHWPDAVSLLHHSAKSIPLLAIYVIAFVRVLRTPRRIRSRNGVE
jgi:hypothetical protein